MRIAERTNDLFRVGKTGENNTMQVPFPVGDWLKEYPGCSIHLAFKRPTENNFYDVKNVEIVGDQLIWTLKRVDVEIAGAGIAELQMIRSGFDEAEKSRYYAIKIERGACGSAPTDPVKDWFIRVIELEEAAIMARHIVTTMGAEAETLPEGAEATAEYDHENNVMRFGIPRGKLHPYASLERVRPYYFKITFDKIPAFTGGGMMPAGCSSFVKGGKLYRNFDWNYDESVTFRVVCDAFEGIATRSTLAETEVFSDDALSQLPYCIVDGRNVHGIMMSTHILYNDFGWHGQGDIPLTKVPYLIMTNVKSMETIEDDLADIIGNLRENEELGEYIAQYLITDGTTTYVLAPPLAADESYELIDITEMPKLTNFRWVNQATVERDAEYMQDRPVGVERWNEIDTETKLEDLRFTKAYEEPDRLSEFIGIRDTDKHSTDEELLAIYDAAHQAYLTRTRDGSLWQTMHSAIYSREGIEELYVQEDWQTNAAGSAGKVDDVLVDGVSVLHDKVAMIDLSGLVPKEEGKGLSTNDYTDADKERVDHAVQEEAGKGLSTNDYTDADKERVAHAVQEEAGKGLSTNDYTDVEKEKLSGIELEANKTIVDEELDGGSTNPVQNKVVSEALDDINQTIAPLPTEATGEHLKNEEALKSLLLDEYVGIIDSIIDNLPQKETMGRLVTAVYQNAGLMEDLYNGMNEESEVIF